MNTHELKTHPEPFNNVMLGCKNFEVRKDDREFKIYDQLYLKEFIPAGYYKATDPEKGFTWRSCIKKINYILRGGNYGIEAGYVVLGITDLK